MAWLVRGDNSIFSLFPATTPKCKFNSLIHEKKVASNVRLRVELTRGDDMSKTVNKSYKNVFYLPPMMMGTFTSAAAVNSRLDLWHETHSIFHSLTHHGNVNISWINFSISSLARRRCNKNTKGKLSKCNNKNDDNDWKNDCDAKKAVKREKFRQFWINNFLKINFSSSTSFFLLLAHCQLVLSLSLDFAYSIHLIRHFEHN